jgi:hypothetical protein
LDYSRPYYNMHNPNESINRILSMYEEQTRENMRILISTIDQTAPSEFASAAASSGASSSLHLPTTYSNKKRQYETETHQQQPPQQQQQPQHSVSMYDMPQQSMTSHHSTNMPGSTFGQPSNNNNNSYWNMGQQQPFAASIGGGYGGHIHNERNEPDVQDYAIDEENRQGDVRYVLARQFKLIASDKQLGYPAYSITKELLGFYRKPSRGGVGRFQPIHKHRQDISPSTMTQATQILEDAILKGDTAVFDTNRHDTLTDMVSEALNYETWTKNPGDNSSAEVEIGRGARDNSPGSF